MMILWLLITSRWFFPLIMMIMVLMFDFIAAWIFWSAAHHYGFTWWFPGRTSAPWTAASFFTLTPVTHLHSLWQFTIVIATIPVTVGETNSKFKFCYMLLHYLSCVWVFETRASKKQPLYVCEVVVRSTSRPHSWNSIDGYDVVVAVICWYISMIMNLDIVKNIDESIISALGRSS